MDGGAARVARRRGDAPAGEGGARLLRSIFVKRGCATLPTPAASEEELEAVEVVGGFFSVDAFFSAAAFT